MAHSESAETIVSIWVNLSPSELKYQWWYQWMQFCRARWYRRIIFGSLFFWSHTIPIIIDTFPAYTRIFAPLSITFSITTSSTTEPLRRSEEDWRIVRSAQSLVHHLICSLPITLNTKFCCNTCGKRCHELITSIDEDSLGKVWLKCCKECWVIHLITRSTTRSISENSATASTSGSLIRCRLVTSLIVNFSL